MARRDNDNRELQVGCRRRLTGGTRTDELQSLDHGVPFLRPVVSG
jgi:hypothetical protein